MSKSSLNLKIFPKSFYKESTKEDKEKRWKETCYFISKDLILVEEEYDDEDYDEFDNLLDILSNGDN